MKNFIRHNGRTLVNRLQLPKMAIDLWHLDRIRTHEIFKCTFFFFKYRPATTIPCPGDGVIVMLSRSVCFRISTISRAPIQRTYGQSLRTLIHTPQQWRWCEKKYEFNNERITAAGHCRPSHGSIAKHTAVATGRAGVEWFAWY